jgi:hypothetical protein
VPTLFLTVTLIIFFLAWVKLPAAETKLNLG